MPESTHRSPPLANGLVYVDSSMPGWQRVKRGAVFRYRDGEGRWVRDADEVSRIRRLAIPPAYRDVWICPLANGHLQATGFDVRGRKQYRYHAAWRALKDETKFDRLEAFGRALPKIRSRVARDLGARPRAPLGREVVLATIVRLLDTTFLRVGNEEYASSNGSFGLTTLRNQHADVRGAALNLRFRGKSGVMHEARLNDPRVSKVVRRCQQLPGQELFQYQTEDGGVRGISSTDVNDYLRSISDADFTAKEFRTWHGTVQALELTRLACDDGGGGGGGNREANTERFSAKEILNAVAAQLGNTPAVCKKAYVHPAVLSLGATLADDADAINDIWAKIALGARGTRHLRAAESRLLALLSQDRRRMHVKTKSTRVAGSFQSSIARVERRV